MASNNQQQQQQQQGEVAASVAAETSSSIGFFGTIIAGLGSLLVVFILLAITLGGLQNSADFIIAVSQTGAQAIEFVANSLVAQAQVVVNTNGGAILQAATAAGLAVVNSTDNALNAAGTIGNSLLQVTLNGFATVAELFSELGSQIVSVFLASCAPSLLNLRLSLVQVVASLQVTQAFEQMIVEPIETFLQFIKL